MENCVFNKLNLEDNTPIRIQIISVGTSLKIIVLQDGIAWKSLVMFENVNQYAIQHKLSLENYIEKLLDYVKTCDPDVTFIINEEEFIVNRLLDNNLRVKYFACKLQKVNYVECVEQLMDEFYSNNVRYLEKLNSAVKEKNEIETYKISCELKLKELIEMKKYHEEEIIGHFVILLNEKKQRIQHLTELLEAFKAGRSPVNPPVAVKSRKKKANVKNVPSSMKKIEAISDSDRSESPDSNSHSDVEDVASNSEKELTGSSEINKPSTSIQAFQFLEDDIAKVPSLPKRIKYERNIEENITAVPSTSKSSQFIKENPDDTLPDTEKKDSASLDFNTQTLLDML